MTKFASNCATSHILSMEQRDNRPKPAASTPEAQTPPAAVAPPMPRTWLPNARRIRPNAAKSTMSDKPSEHDDQEMPLVSHSHRIAHPHPQMRAGDLSDLSRVFYFAQKIYAFASERSAASFPKGATMISTDVTSPFSRPSS